MLHLQTGNGSRLDIPDMSAPSGATGRFRLPSGEPGHTLFKIVSSARGYHAWAWQSFGIFCFYGMFTDARNRLVDCHTQYGMETFKGHSFFVARNAHVGFPAQAAG